MELTHPLLLGAAAAPLLVAYVISCLRDPLRYALPSYAVLIPFSSLFAIAPGPFGSVSSLLGLLLGVGLIFQLVTSRNGSPSIPAAVPVWLAFLALCGLSVFWSIAPGETIDDWTVLASQVLLFAALAITRVEPFVLWLFEHATVLGGVLVVGYGLTQLLFLGGLPVSGEGAGRFGDDLLGANNQAASLLLPIAIASLRALRGNLRARLAFGAASLFMVFGVVMTGSRGGLLATLVALGTVILLGGARRATVVGLAAAAAVLLLAVFALNPVGVGERQLSRSDTSSGRTDIWTVGLHSCREHCLIGAGWGAFPTVYRETLPSVSEAKVLRRGTAYEPHNIFLLSVVEAGAAGLLLVLTGLLLALRTALRLPPSMRAPATAALLGTVVSSFFLSNLEYKFFWAVLAYVAIAGSVAEAARGGQSMGGALPEGGRLLELRKDVR